MVARWLAALVSISAACAGCFQSYDKVDVVDGTDAASGPDSASCTSLASGDDCTAVPLCGCSADQNCLRQGGHLKCLPAGPGARNSVCSGDADCGPGMECFLTAAGGLCLPRCQAGGSCDGLCALVNRLPVKNRGRDRPRVRCEATPVA